MQTSNSLGDLWAEGYRDQSPPIVPVGNQYQRINLKPFTPDPETKEYQERLRRYFKHPVHIFGFRG